jgi:hypothetical protein
MGDIANGDTEYSYALCRYQGNISSKDGVARDRTEVTIVDNGFFSSQPIAVAWPACLCSVSLPSHLDFHTSTLLNAVGRMMRQHCPMSGVSTTRKFVGSPVIRMENLTVFWHRRLGKLYFLHMLMTAKIVPAFSGSVGRDPPSGIF